MPIKSYLAHPHKNEKQALINALSGIEKCEVIPSENKDLLIVVTDTDNNLEEDHLKEQIESISSLKLLVMVSGFDTPKSK
ncbi:hypothetical protein [Aestuariibaculum suncheonense]|uniref:Uncharacterized protein n=1 Tax=Aestuariibaculum suncheonense TaxID=1028745 RepID=A0A8J6Q863_9FLAO|nr:hypothetical protein [Aestuariibaculum suncheonense]MBD0835616.1 hypothetical protein [Aestuariibaculum suncheonense]